MKGFGNTETCEDAIYRPGEVRPWQWSGADSQWAVTTLSWSPSSRWSEMSLKTPVVQLSMDSFLCFWPCHCVPSRLTWDKSLNEIWVKAWCLANSSPKPLRTHFSLSAAGKLCMACTSIHGWSQDQVLWCVLILNGRSLRELEAIEKQAKVIYSWWTWRKVPWLC